MSVGQEGAKRALTQNVALLRQVFLLVFLRTYRPPKGVKKIWLKHKVNRTYPKSKQLRKQHM